MGRILIIDSNNCVARYNHVFSDALNRDGFPIGGLFGIVQAARKFLAANADHDAVVCVVDSGVPEWRMQVAPEYKAQRAGDRKTAEEEQIFQNYRLQVKHVRNVIRHAGLGFARAKGWEGDDAIAGLTEHRFRDRGCTILSTDKDFTELADGKRVQVYDPMHNCFMEPNPWYLLERCLDPKQSDNLDGVPGVGEVGAAAAVQLWRYHAEATKEPEKVFHRTSRPAMEDFLTWCEYAAQWGVTQEQMRGMDSTVRKPLQAAIAKMSPDEKKACKAAAKIVPCAQKVRDNYQVTCLRSIARRCHEATQLSVEPADKAAFKDMAHAYGLNPVLEDMSVIWPTFERLDNAGLLPEAAAHG